MGGTRVGAEVNEDDAPAPLPPPPPPPPRALREKDDEVDEGEGATRRDRLRHVLSSVRN